MKLLKTTGEREQEEEVREFAAAITTTTTTTTTINQIFLNQFWLVVLQKEDYIFNHIIIVLMKMKQRNYL
jgi:hypothetical protein